MVTIFLSILYYMKVVKRIDLKSSHHKEMVIT